MFGSALSIFLYFIIFVYLCKNKRYQKIYYAIRTLPRDIHFFKCGAKTLFTIKYWSIRKKNIAKIFLENVRKFPNKIAFRCGDNTLTFQEIENLTNQMARYFKEECKLTRGDSVALYLPNSELYACYWLALSKIGVISALINNNQVGKVLQHSLTVCKAKLIIYDISYTPILKDMEDFLTKFQLIHVGVNKNNEQNNYLIGSKDIKSALTHYSTRPLLDELNQCTMQDQLLYIFTSGTTGLPKAAIITHSRYLIISLGPKNFGGITEDDIVYDTLPMYHSAGGIIGVGQTIVGGSTVVIRQKFSASNFWSDCIKYNCTVAQYIGEICRYLLLTPETPKDRAHKVRLITGNGVRPQIWEQFTKRFNIKQICEFYGSTEGNTNVVNAWNKPGAVGYMPWLISVLKVMALIKVNERTLEPERDSKTGLCISCDVNEPGLCIGKLLKTSLTNFQGYADPEATKKKYLHNVFKEGDVYVNSGDILVKDEFGYLYFRDRTGDTFRWKGENVSTSEVEAVISNIVGLKDATVYGVEIPGVEGRAGMVAIVDEHGQLDLNRLERGVLKELSSYARPLFVRIIKEIPMTGTFKMQKIDLQKEGFNIDKINDPIYYLKDGKHYLKLDQVTYNEIVNQKLRF